MGKAFIACLLVLAVGARAAENPACKPEARDDWSKATSAQYTQLAQKGQVGPVLFLGDSITQLWSFSKDNRWPGGLEVWNKVFAPLKATNFGIAGDTTGHLLWRVTEGKQLDNIHPKVVVLLIGTNNFRGADTPEQVAEGVKAIVAVIRAKLPESKLILFGVFPRDFKADSPMRAKVKQVNQELVKLGDNQAVFYLDMAPKLLSPDGSATADILRDGLHLSPKGYQVWADSLLPVVQALLEGRAPAL